MNTNIELYKILMSIWVILSPIFYKLLKSKSYRNQFKIAIKSIFNGLINRVNFNHYLFNNKDYYKSMVDNIEFKGCNKKTKLFRILLKSKIDCVTENAFQFLIDNKTTLSKMNKSKLRGKINLLVNDIIEGYEEIIPKKYYTYLENKSKADKAFNFIYHGTNTHIGFKEYHNPNIKPISGYIADIPLYTESTNEQLVYNVFGLFDAALLNAIKDLREHFENMNGDLKKILK